ncbi:hypothetical protein RUM43_007410 [Polyplax serrata]|uniref:Uncharacterized protein n=1 Tax=Polyplax serrata TaxID=468196 RepID=A0AAN8P8I1_POLSC
MSRKQKLNLIGELTTHKCDYQVWPLDPGQPKPDVRPREDIATKPPPPFVQIDSQSHAPYRPSAHVPFDLYVERKPIVRTDPRECFKLRKKLKNQAPTETGNSPILSPALPIDKIENEKDMQTVVKYTYTGMHKILMEEAAMKNSKIPNPGNRVISEGGDLSFKPQLYPPLPPGWLGAANHWDCLQSRNLGDPTKNFWLRRGPDIECSCCCNPLPTMLSKETKDQIRQLILEDNLRLPYDITKTGYRGFRQICAKGVPLEKKKAS